MSSHQVPHPYHPTRKRKHLAASALKLEGQASSLLRRWLSCLALASAQRFFLLLRPCELFQLTCHVHGQCVHTGQLSTAQAEARSAVELDPSERFAIDKSMLAQILNASTQGSAAQPKTSGNATMCLVLFGAAALGAIAWLATRSRRNQEASAERERWTGALREAHKDLADAMAASDANPANTAEVKLANYDWVRNESGA